MVLTAYGVGVVGTIDNFLKPMILKGAMQVHPLVAFLAVFGGLLSFGPSGILLGPLVLSLANSALRIYESEMLGVAQRAEGSAGRASASDQEIETEASEGHA